MTHLWEHKHPYYTSESNFYSNDCIHYHDSWEDFIDEWGDSDEDYNCLFRWDWKERDPVDYDSVDEIPEGDLLQLTFILQRKGIYLVNFVNVTKDDEDAVRAYLETKWDYMQRIWGGIAPSP